MPNMKRDASSKLFYFNFYYSFPGYFFPPWINDAVTLIPNGLSSRQSKPENFGSFSLQVASTVSLPFLAMGQQRLTKGQQAGLLRSSQNMRPKNHSLAAADDKPKPTTLHTHTHTHKQQMQPVGQSIDFLPHLCNCH